MPWITKKGILRMLEGACVIAQRGRRDKPTSSLASYYEPRRVDAIAALEAENTIGPRCKKLREELEALRRVVRGDHNDFVDRIKELDEKIQVQIRNLGESVDRNKEHGYRLRDALMKIGLTQHHWPGDGQTLIIEPTKAGQMLLETLALLLDKHGVRVVRKQAPRDKFDVELLPKPIPKE